MSQRERWTVYPLLFMALILGLRDFMPLFRPAEISYDRVRCNELVAREIRPPSTAPDELSVRCNEVKIIGPTPDGKHKRQYIQLGRNVDGAGEITVYGPGGKPIGQLSLDDSGLTGELQVSTIDGRLSQRLRAPTKLRLKRAAPRPNPPQPERGQKPNPGTKNPDA